MLSGLHKSACTWHPTTDARREVSSALWLCCFLEPSSAQLLPNSELSLDLDFSLGFCWPLHSSTPVWHELLRVDSLSSRNFRVKSESFCWCRVNRNHEDSPREPLPSSVPPWGSACAPMPSLHTWWVRQLRSLEPKANKEKCSISEEKVVETNSLQMYSLLGILKVWPDCSVWNSFNVD